MASICPTGDRYPPTRRSDTIHLYSSETHGQVKVPDPYHWLEGNTGEVRTWTATQEVVTKGYLEQNIHRQLLEDDIRSNTNYAKFSAPSLQADGYWYWSFNSGLQPQSVIYRSNKKSPEFYNEDDAEIFFDTNLLSEDGTMFLHEETCVFSPDGKLWAYGVYDCGSDYCIIYVRPTSTPFAIKDGVQPSHNDGRLVDELPFVKSPDADSLQFVKFSSIVWTSDSKGFFYKRYPDDNTVVENVGTGARPDPSPVFCYHRLGSSQSEDIVVVKDEIHNYWGRFAQRHGSYLFLSTVRDMSWKNLLWVTDLSKNVIGPAMVWDKIIDEFKASYELITIEKTILYARTNMNASNYKLITIDMADHARETRDLLPEDPEALLAEAKAVNNDYFAVIYKRNVNDEVYIYTFAGVRLMRLAPDFVGTATLSASRQESWFYVTMTGFTCPGIIAQYDFSAGEEGKRWQVRRTMKVKGLQPQDFEVQQVWFPSTDGTRIPMFIIRKRSTKFDGTAPAIQFGYGGFGASTGPWFSPSILTFLCRYGGIFALVNIRGGGEFGEKWHLTGIKEHKTQSFDDFIAATHFLIDNTYAAPKKIALNGRSNGGFLVAACVNRAPEGLIAAIITEVGVLDLLSFPDFKIASIWTSEYGDPRNPHDFDFIYPVSAMHNVPSDKVLPPTFILTSDHDDRCVPMHSFKYAAMQFKQSHSPHPHLLYVVKKAGHNLGRPTEMRVQIAAAKLGFLVQSLGLEWKDTERLM